MVQTRPLALTQEEIAPGSLFQEVGEILRPHLAPGIVGDTGSPGNVARNVCSEDGTVGVVHGRRITQFIVYIGRDAERRRLSCHDFLEPLFNLHPHLFAEGPNRRAEPAGFGDDVIRRTGMDLRHRNYDFIQRIDIPAGNGLKCADHADHGRDWVDAFMGIGAMPTSSGDLYLRGIDGSHDRTRRCDKAAEGNGGRVMESIDFTDPESIEHALAHHHLATAAVLFRRLEDQRHTAAEATRLGQVFRGPEQHRGMAVMAAGMHDARHGRSMGNPGFLSDRQSVHIGTQPNRRPLALPLNDRNDAARCDTFMDFVNPEVPQAVGDESRSLVTVKAKFGMGMQMAAPFGHLRREIGDAVKDGHVDSQGASCEYWPHDRNSGIIAMTLNRAASDRLVHDPEGGVPRLLEIMARLRDPANGCPWDIEQDFATIAPYTIEEAYEVADAIERGAWCELEGELGDLLFQTVYHAQMGKEAGHFSFESVTKAISDKMVARHPHVFGDESREKTAEQQTRDWEKLKAAERAGKAERGTLDGVAVGLPALTRAVKLQNRAARVGFDWPSTDEVIDKITEEARELNEARGGMSAAEVFEEFGDLLFVIANLARHLKIDPEAALRAANTKFTRRFRAIEAALAERGKRPEDSDLAEMDALWDLAKSREKAEAARLCQQRADDPQGRMAEERQKLAEEHSHQQQAQQRQ